MIVRRALLVLLLLSNSAVAAEPVQLRAGRLSMLFEPENAFVRYVRVGEHKVLQGISAPVRDQSWGTVRPAVSNVRVRQNAESFTLTFDVSCRQGDIDFSWQGSITGDAKGNATFTFDGQAHADFLRNRIGFCVLHGPEAAGKRCVVETVDGKSVEGRLPTFISPHQPFKNIRSIAHEVSDGVWAKVRMEGDTFEMEDQRNWTDASYKTYCTPLDIPYPVRVTKGTKISQRIQISVDGIEKVREPAGGAGGPVVVRVLADSQPKQRLPGIGVRVSSQTARLSDIEIAWLRELALDHLRVDVTPAEESASVDLKRAAEQAKQLNAGLHVGLHLGKDAEKELQSLAATLKGIQPPTTWLLIAADEQQVQIAREFLKRTGQTGRLGRGEDTNFTELNRNRPDPRTIDVVSYGINPQIHAFDDTSIIETLEIQGDTVRSARQFIGDRPLLVSPITLRKQTLNEPPPAGELPANVDPRQPTLFAAGWTLGSIKYLAEAGVESLTYYETVGWLGIMESQSGSPLPYRFPSRRAQLFPIYHVLQEISPLAGGMVRETTSADPMSVVGLTVEKGGLRRLVLANLTPAEQTTHVQGFARQAIVRRLDAKHQTPTEFYDPLRASDGDVLILQLPSYGIAVLEQR